ncbi:hypothetical protein TrRE_jg4264 [Triparma retinervis]|uniref:Uncharacterized protein n=1 Tax=Triparma retinervis TaxID=2557542 RepID=A0A9W7FGC2_9STRA|nr:hypothetical protein TrRE_jg4264 [Triparma retinervis]
MKASSIRDDAKGYSKDAYVRLAAEADNFKKNRAKTGKQSESMHIASTIKKFLPIQTSLNEISKNLSSSPSPDALRVASGYSSLSSSLSGCFKSLGMSTYHAVVGETFDGGRHEEEGEREAWGGEGEESGKGSRRVVTQEGKNNKVGLEATRATFGMEPDEIMNKVLLHKRLITKGSLPQVQHIIERLLFNIWGIGWLPRINARFTPLRHKNESDNLRQISFRMCFVWDMLGTLLLKGPAIATMAFHGFEPIFVKTATVGLLLCLIATIGTVVRESSWFCKAQRITETHCYLCVHRLHFWKIDTALGESMTAYKFVEDLAVRASDNELLLAVLRKPSLFDNINKDERKSSVLERENTNKDRMDEKYSANILGTEILPLLAAASVAGLFVVGWFLEGGSNLPDPAMQTAAYVQVVLASISLLIYFILIAKAFVAEAVIDFWRHQRLILFFLNTIGAMSDTDMSRFGYKLSTVPSRMSSNERSKVSLRVATDLNAVFACYDFLVEYLRLRNTFHNGFVAFLIIIDVSAALVFLISTLYQDRFAVGVLAQVMLFAFAAVCSMAMVVIAVPLTRTSWMVQDVFLNFLLDHQLFLQSELSAPSNSLVFSPPEGEGIRREFEKQIILCRAKIKKMEAKSEHIKILGADATTATLAKLLAVVGGSLVSGLMRQATNV